MAQYKVPQDVEADDKLLGPFTFRQFIYLLVVAGLCALAYALFQIFPLLAIIPIPFILLFAALALPLRKDQPMETYLSALVSFYLKPHHRLWVPGQRESTIKITAPKVIEKPRARNISEEEAGHRLSFLADLVDSEGYAIKNTSNPMREEFVAEAQNAIDIFDNPRSQDLVSRISTHENTRHDEIVNQMKATIAKNNRLSDIPELTPTIHKYHNDVTAKIQKSAESVIVQPGKPASSTTPKPQPESASNPPKNDIINLANNPDFSVQTIQKEAGRINNNQEKEVFISLH